MPPIPVINYKIIRNILLKLGFFEVRQKGSHVFFRHSDGKTTTVPNHKGRDLAVPLVRAILREIEISVEEFIQMMKTKKGFTLTEILVALAVLAIIAAVTVPSLISITNKHNFTNGLKRANLTLKTATGELMAENSGTMIKLISFDCGPELRDKYCTKLNCIKKCDGNSVDNGCFANPKSLSGIDTGWNFNNKNGAVLNNGMTITFDWYTSACNTATYQVSGQTGCSNGAGLYIDVNGLKPPNVLGRDVFSFIVHANGIAAAGLPGTQYQTANWIWSTTCNPAMASGNWAEYLNGLGCGGKVLTEGTMNY